MTTLPQRPEKVTCHRHFLLGAHVSWTDIMRRKQNREALKVLDDRLHNTREQSDIDHIVHVKDLIEIEGDRWFLI